jgi:hypothetical protein
LDKTFEQRITKHFSRSGPLVAIGRPGEELPELGAARLYVPDDAWQLVVQDLLSRAGLAILQIGATPGIKWELTTVLEVLRPEQVVLYVPYRIRRKAEAREALYRAFLAWAEPLMPAGLPRMIGGAFSIYFGPDPRGRPVY